MQRGPYGSNQDYRGGERLPPINDGRQPGAFKHHDDERHPHQDPRYTGGVDSKGGAGTSPQQQFDCSQGRPIQLVAANPETGEYQLNSDAFEELNEYKGNIAFVAVAGRFKTGKSFLLNRLLNLKTQGFTIDPQSAACTEGIWIWSQPVFVEKDNLHIFFLDVEGINMPEKSPTQDIKLFSLALLISNLFIYNSLGAIDDNSLAELMLLTNLSKQIVLSEGETSTEHALSYYTPKLLWALRDFNLGGANPTQYLESALTDQSMKGHPNSKKVRQAILNYFKDRDCVTFDRPVRDDRDLFKLNSVSDNQIRPEFLQQLNTLREKILAKISPKQLKGVNLNITMYMAMIEKYIECFNANKPLNIMQAWEHLVLRQCQDAIEESKALYDYAINEYFYNVAEEKDLESIYNILKNIRDGTLEKFSKITSAIENEAQAENFKADIKAYVDEQEKVAVESNEAEAYNVNEELLRNLAQNMRDNINQGIYDASKIDDFCHDLTEILLDYNKQGRLAISKTEVLAKFFQEFFRDAVLALVDEIKKKQNQSENKTSAEAMNFKKKEEAYNLQIKTLQKQLASQDEQLDKLKSDKQKEEAASSKAKKDLEKAKAEEQANLEALRKKQEEEKKILEEKRNRENEELRKQNEKILKEMEDQMRKKKACCTIF